jgi:protein-tyrosine phosphatase
VPAFVDCHSHVVPSGDDGAQTLADGLELCELASSSGTEVLYATPHVWPHLLLGPERERQIEAAFAELREAAPLDLRLGYELTPAPELLDEDPAHYVLEGTNVVLVEVPFAGPADGFLELAEHIEAAGLTPLVAHPERTEAVQSRRELADEIGERGWPLQVNSTSLTGRHGPEASEIGWRLVERGHAKVVASDGHRLTRPARLDDAYELAKERVGEEAALPLFEGAALGLRASAVIQADPASGADGYVGKAHAS